MGRYKYLIAESNRKADTLNQRVWVGLICKLKVLRERITIYSSDTVMFISTPTDVTIKYIIKNSGYNCIAKERPIVQTTNGAG